MKVELKGKIKSNKTIIKKCHLCGQLSESHQEPQKCNSCSKSFLPLNYFSKIHDKNSKDYTELYAYSHELEEDDVIKGLTVLW